MILHSNLDTRKIIAFKDAAYAGAKKIPKTTTVIVSRLSQSFSNSSNSVSKGHLREVTRNYQPDVEILKTKMIWPQTQPE